MSLSRLAFNGGEEVIIIPPDLKKIYITNILNQNCPFNPRDGVQLVSYNNELRLLGGWNGADTPMSKKEDWRSSDGITWIKNSDALWDFPRHRFICKVLNNKIYVALNDPYSLGDNTAYSFDFESGWQSLGELDLVDNQNLYFHFLHRDGNNKEWIYFGGGQRTVNATDGVNNYMHRWDGITLEKVCDFPLAMGTRSNSIAVSYEGNIYVAGGGEYFNNGLHTYHDDIWVSEDDGATFTLHGTNSLLAKQYADVEVWDGKIWFLDGNTRFSIGSGNVRGLYNGTDLLNLNYVSGWGKIPERHASGICVHNDELYIVAGNLWNDSYKISKHLINA